MNEDEFRGMCADHDLTYDYSDDSRVWRSGGASLAKIIEASKSLPHDVVVRVWNAEVDRKIIPGHREPWYWKYTKAPTA